MILLIIVSYFLAAKYLLDLIGKFGLLLIKLLYFKHYESLAYLVAVVTIGVD